MTLVEELDSSDDIAIEPGGLKRAGAELTQTPRTKRFEVEGLNCCGSLTAREESRSVGKKLTVKGLTQYDINATTLPCANQNGANICNLKTAPPIEIAGSCTTSIGREIWCRPRLVPGPRARQQIIPTVDHSAILLWYSHVAEHGKVQPECQTLWCTHAWEPWAGTQSTDQRSGI